MWALRVVQADRVWCACCVWSVCFCTCRCFGCYVHTYICFVLCALCVCVYLKSDIFSARFIVFFSLTPRSQSTPATPLSAKMASKNTPSDDADIPEETFTEFAKGGGMQADVDELITKFRVKIDKLRQRVIDIVPQDDPQYDDLFYLRYVLSFKVSAAIFS